MGRKIYFQISLSFNFNSYAKVMTAAIIDVRNESTFNVIYFRMLRSKNRVYLMLYQ